MKYLITFALSLLIIISSSCIRTKKDDPDTLKVKIGDELPAFSIKTLAGTVVTNESFVGKKGTIIFFNSGCKDCQRELPELDKEYKMMVSSAEKDEYLWVCIAREEGAADVARYWGAEGFTIPVSPQTDRSVFSKFAISGIPLVIRTEGTTITSISHYD